MRSRQTDGIRRFSGNRLSKNRLSKKVYIKSYGCQMNVYDSDRMADVLAPDGYTRIEDAESADLVILNTCHIREKAAEKVYSELGRLRRDDGPMIAVAGCVAQAEGDEVLRRAPHVDLVVGPQAYHRLPELVAKAQNARGVIDTDFPVETKFDLMPPPRVKGVSAFLTVQEGCDKFCAFCVVPYTRGSEYSRPAAEIIAEAQLMVDGGVREITLLGQNVNAWHGTEGGLAALIRSLAEIGGLDRIRYTTSHPRDMDDKLIRAHAEVPALMPYLHLPVQSGSNDVLARMNRKHTADDYLRIIDDLRAACPDIALSSDFIVGHPGEDDAAFEDTLSLIEQVGFSQAYSFKYSPRPGTPAAEMDDQIPEAVKSERLARLQDLLNRQQEAFNRETLGKTLPVLLDRTGRSEDQLAGRSPFNQAVHVTCADAQAAESALGQMVEVTITGAHPHSISGALLSSDADDGVRH